MQAHGAVTLEQELVPQQLLQLLHGFHDFKHPSPCRCFLLVAWPASQVTNTATLTPVGGNQGVLSKAASATFSVTGCNVLPTITLSNIQTWAAVTWSWAMQMQAIPNVYQVNVGAGATANYQAQLTRTFATGNYAMTGTLVIVNPATYPMYISSVTLMSTTGQVGALPPACLGGSNVGGSTISTGVNNMNPWVSPYTGTASTNVGAFTIAAGAQIQCVFNVSAGVWRKPLHVAVWETSVGWHMYLNVSLTKEGVPQRE